MFLRSMKHLMTMSRRRRKFGDMQTIEIESRSPHKPIGYHVFRRICLGTAFTARAYNVGWAPRSPQQREHR